MISKRTYERIPVVHDKKSMNWTRLEEVFVSREQYRLLWNQRENLPQDHVPNLAYTGFAYNGVFYVVG